MNVTWTINDLEPRPANLCSYMATNQWYHKSLVLLNYFILKNRIPLKESKILMENMNKIKHAPNLNFVILASSRLTPFRATTSRHLPRGRSPQYFIPISFCFPGNQADINNIPVNYRRSEIDSNKWNTFLNWNKRPIDQTSFSIIVTWSSLKKHRFLNVIYMLLSGFSNRWW